MITKNIKDSINYFNTNLNESIKRENILNTIVSTIFLVIEMILFAYLIGVILFSNNLKKIFYVALFFGVLIFIAIFYNNYFFGNLSINNKQSTKDIIVNSLLILYDDKIRENNKSFYLTQYYVGLFLSIYKIFGILIGKHKMQQFF